MRKIFIKINLNVQPFKVNIHDRLKRDWIEKRLDIFMKSNFKSLIAQTNQNFIAKIIYEDSTAEIVFDVLKKYPKLPDNIVLYKRSENFIGDGEINKHDKLLILRLDSDDMYHKSVVDGLMRAKIGREQEAILYQDGYLYESEKNRIISCYHKSPPFYALIYNGEDYLNGKRYHLPHGHHMVYRLNKDIIRGESFIWHVHGLNTRNKFHLLVKRYGTGDMIIERKEVNKILSGFGL